MSFKARVTATGIAVAAAALVMPPAAYGDVSDLPAAEITNALDQAAAVTFTSDPNLTCDVKAGGRDLVQHTNYVVGEVYGQDFGVASGECASLDASRIYPVSLRVQIEYFTPTSLTTGYWTPVPGCATTTGASSTRGVAVPPPAVTTCMYTSTSGYLNRYHRAHGILTPFVVGADVRHAYSPTWFMAP